MKPNLSKGFESAVRVAYTPRRFYCILTSLSSAAVGNVRVCVCVCVSVQIAFSYETSFDSFYASDRVPMEVASSLPARPYVAFISPVPDVVISSCWLCVKERRAPPAPALMTHRYWRAINVVVLIFFYSVHHGVSRGCRVIFDSVNVFLRASTIRNVHTHTFWTRFLSFFSFRRELNTQQLLSAHVFPLQEEN